LDLASTRDINALSMVFRRDGDYYVKCRYWMPEEVADIRGKQDRAQAKRWASQGFITQTDGNVTDYGVICAELCEVAEQFDLQCLAYDPWGPARAMAQQLAAAGFPDERLKEFKQMIGNFAAPSKEFDRRIANQTLRHDGDPVLRWMVGNVAKEQDKNNNIRPSKSRSADKIDGVVATIMALGVAMVAGEVGSVYEKKGSLPL
jgi:phage terminase large subunit-like protein